MIQQQTFISLFIFVGYKFHPIVFFLCEVPADNVCYMLASLGNAKRVAIAAIGNGRERISG